MVPDAKKTSLGLEYFCNEGDALWSMSDSSLIGMGKQELEYLGLARQADIEDGMVIREPKAYPVYDQEYRACLAIIKDYLEEIQKEVEG